MKNLNDISSPGPLRIGPLCIDPPTALAPMAGVTDIPFRTLCKEYGVGVVLTELVSADGIIRDNRQTWHYLEAVPKERPIGAQIYGSDLAVLAEAAGRVAALNRFDFIDINCGCPVPKIISKGAGVNLMRRPELLHDMVRSVRGAVSLPVTTKTRIGLNPELVNIDEVSQAIEEGGADAIFIHARLASARHNGPADWELLGEVKASRSIPIVGNGGIQSGKDARDMIELTGVDGVMIGRGAIGNPWIFAEIVAAFNGTQFEPPTVAERRETIGLHLRNAIEHFGSYPSRKKKTAREIEVSATRHFRSHLVRYLSGCPGVKDLMRTMDKMSSCDEILEGIDRILERSTPVAPRLAGSPVL